MLDSAASGHVVGPTATVELPDVQAGGDDRGVPLDSVGIDGLRLPATIIDTDGKRQHTVLRATAGVSVRAAERAAHMSRLVDELLNVDGNLALSMLPSLHQRLIKRCGADSAEIQLAFPWFIAKTAPVSRAHSSLDVDVRYAVSGGQRRDGLRLRQHIRVPVTTLCPCSKTISRYGAHNQRTDVSLDLEVTEWLAIAQLVELVETQASCEIFGLLKRVDEKYVTEKAYQSPKFVEDLARDLYLRLHAERSIYRSSIRVESHESIHNHAAFASIDAVHSNPQT